VATTDRTWRRHRRPPPGWNSWNAVLAQDRAPELESWIDLVRRIGQPGFGWPDNLFDQVAPRAGSSRRSRPLLARVRPHSTDRSGERLTAPGQTQAEGDASTNRALPQSDRGPARRSRAGPALGTEAALAADQDRAQRSRLAACPGWASRDELVTAGAEAARWSPFGAYREFNVDPGALSAVAEGRAAVQDEAESARLPALTPGRLARRPDPVFWLDLCRAPGGKGQACWPDRGRARRNRLVAADLHEPPGQASPRAPCSVTGNGARDQRRRDSACCGPWAFDRVPSRLPSPGRQPSAQARGAVAAGSGQTSPASAELQRRCLTRRSRGPTRPGGVVASVTCLAALADTRDVLDDAPWDAGSTSLCLDCPCLLAEVPDLSCRQPYFPVCPVLAAPAWHDANRCHRLLRGPARQPSRLPRRLPAARRYRAAVPLNRRDRAHAGQQLLTEPRVRGRGRRTAGFADVGPLNPGP